MPFDRRPALPVKTVELSSFDFDAKKLTSKPECPKVLLSVMENILLKNAPEDASVRETRNTTLVDYNGKRMTISAWKFNTADCPMPAFKKLLREGYDVSVVLAVHFFENGKFTPKVSKFANMKLAIGFVGKYLVRDDKVSSIANKVRTQYGAGPETSDTNIGYFASRYARDLANNIAQTEYDFFNPDDELKDAAIEILKNFDDTFKISSETAHSFKASVALKDYFVDIKFNNDRSGDCTLTFTIPHKYTETDRVYGARYADTTKTYTVKSVDDLEAIDLHALMKYLYDNRFGTNIYQGSLGT